MTMHNIEAQLQKISKSGDFSSQSEDVVDSWVSDGIGFEAVRPVLRFMEENPSIEYGMPGALVHFLEGFYLRGYEDELIDSIRRKPTFQTVWMLNRLINGAKSSDMRMRYINELRNARSCHQLDSATLGRIDHFLGRLSE